jgi:serralysin
MAKPTFTLAQIKDRLDSGAGWAGSTITYAMPDTAPGVGGPNAGFQPMTAVMKAQAAIAFELWDDVIAPSLSQVSSGGNISFSYSTSTGNSTYTSTTYVPAAGRDILKSANIWADATWSTHDQDSDLRPGSYGVTTYLHEIGHALGLDHPGNYDGSASYAADALYAQDTRRYTLMSYFDAEAAGDGTRHKDSYGATPLLHDIAAIQAIYGADLTTRKGATTYGFNSTADRDAFDFTINKAPVVAIWDAGGRDTLDLSGYAMAQSIDLRAGKFSSVGGLTNNLAIAFGVTLENAVGGSGADQITGNSVRNLLKGGAGADELNGLGGNDWLRGGVGKDIINGGAGSDVAYYAGNASTYTVKTLADDTVRVIGGSDGGDTLIGVEKLIFADQTVLL